MESNKKRYAVFFTVKASGEDKQAEVDTPHGAGHAIELATGARPFEMHREANVTVAGVAGYKNVSAYEVKR